MVLFYIQGGDGHTNFLSFSVQRCRGWYDTGRNAFLANGTELHITAPYQFAVDNSFGKIFAQTATMAVYDPGTGEHIGQTLLDFVAQPIYRALENNTHFQGKDGFPILITANTDGQVHETIIGPGVSEGEDSVDVSQAVMEYDYICKKNKECDMRIQEFEKIVTSMQSGESAGGEFVRKTKTGDLEEMYIAYAPAYVTVPTPVDSSDYSRGVKLVEQLVYSVALVETEEGLLEPFREIEETTKKQTNVAIAVLSVVIFLATICIVYISHRLAKSFTEPMLYLLQLLQNINK